MCKVVFALCGCFSFSPSVSSGLIKTPCYFHVAYSVWVGKPMEGIQWEVYGLGLADKLLKTKDQFCFSPPCVTTICLSLFLQSCRKMAAVLFNFAMF